MITCLTNSKISRLSHAIPAFGP
uniref:Uncharacterized protein n=1 Tax=Arundo donax TaxID=35708 RepID=A0A0A8YVV3_ARUDO